MEHQVELERIRQIFAKEVPYITYYRVWSEELLIENYKNYIDWKNNGQN